MMKIKVDNTTNIHLAQKFGKEMFAPKVVEHGDNYTWLKITEGITVFGDLNQLQGFVDSLQKAIDNH